MQFKILIGVLSVFGVLLSLIAESIPGDAKIVSYALQGGAVSIMFVILYFGFNYFSKALRESQNQNSALFEKTLADIKSMNNTHIEQINAIYKQTAEQNQNNFNKLVSVVEENGRSYAFFSQVITRMDGKIDAHTQFHNTERKVQS